MLPKTEFVEMERHITLQDDIKEYWGFYLLKDSVVKVSTCSRYVRRVQFIIDYKHNIVIVEMIKKIF